MPSAQARTQRIASALGRSRAQAERSNKAIEHAALQVGKNEGRIDQTEAFLVTARALIDQWRNDGFTWAPKPDEVPGPEELAKRAPMPSERLLYEFLDGNRQTRQPKPPVTKVGDRTNRFGKEFFVTDVSDRGDVVVVTLVHGSGESSPSQ
jgi:hypothetical protein